MCFNATLKGSCAWRSCSYLLCPTQNWMLSMKHGPKSIRRPFMSGGTEIGNPGLENYCKLGDFLAFMVSYGSHFQTGSGRLLGLALVIFKQVGNYLSDNQEMSLTPTDKRSLPLVVHAQRKIPLDNQDTGDDETLGKQDSRLACLAYMKDVCLALGQHRSRSIAIVTDAADIKGANVSLFFAFSPCVQAGGLLPHQAPVPSQCHIHVIISLQHIIILDMGMAMNLNVSADILDQKSKAMFNTRGNKRGGLAMVLCMLYVVFGCYC